MRYDLMAPAPSYGMSTLTKVAVAPLVLTSLVILAPVALGAGLISLPFLPVLAPFALLAIPAAYLFFRSSSSETPAPVAPVVAETEGEGWMGTLKAAAIPLAVAGAAGAALYAYSRRARRRRRR